MFLIAICCQFGDKWQSTTLYPTIFDLCLSKLLTFLIAAYPCEVVVAEISSHYNVFQKHKAEISKLEYSLKEKTKENKRLKDNFDTLKMANDVQKKEVRFSGAWVILKRLDL